MQPQELEGALQQLATLAREEYHASLGEIAAQLGDSDERRILRIGRLLGVTLKRPFATSKDLEEPSDFSGAYRTWTLMPASAFDDAQARSCWQYRALESLCSDPDVIQALGGQLNSVYSLAEIAQSERGFFWFLATSWRRYLCGDPNLRRKIDREVQGARRGGLDLKNITPDIIVASGGLTIGAELVHNIPALGTMGAPVIAGLVFIIYSVGLDAFCRWTSDHKFFHPEFPNSDRET
jgi:hypothetical protein